MSLPLEGVRVVEVAHYVAVPAAGALLADLGADVVKVEFPRGEIYRRTRPKFAGYDSDFPENPPFHMDNKGKRSIVLDLKRSEACDALVRLVDKAEIFITNLLPMRRRKYGVDHETLLERNPRLLFGAISGYGNGGEGADWPAFDYSAYWARTGLMDMMRDAGTPPSLQRPAVGDHAAAVNLVCGLLAAMRLRDATGAGQHVDVSLLQTGFHILGTDVANALALREPAKRHDRSRAPNPLWNSYPVKGDRWIILVMIDADRYWLKFCAAIDRPELANDERFENGFQRNHNCAELIEILEQEFARHTLEEWRDRLDGAGLIWSPVNQVHEAIEDPQAKAMGYFQELTHPEIGAFETVGPPFCIDGVDLGARRAISSLGADGEDLLREAGLDEHEIERLVATESE
jgi:crotonobetainyl-CoA:carnitine CoA-transferase CaiB-like acyl-CoA transferase